MADLMDENTRAVAHVLQARIQDLGYPVGLGIAPHPDWAMKLAHDLLQLVKALGRG